MNMKKKMSYAEKDDGLKVIEEHPIMFNGKMRKKFVEGVFQDAKGYFESATSGKVSIGYEDFNIKGHEFGFKLKLERCNGCTKQLFNEVSSALVNVINYMFRGGNEEYDLSFFTEDNLVEVELVSNW